MNECTLCENPFPYLCEECLQHLQEEETTQKKYIGSGEDVILEYVEQQE